MRRIAMFAMILSLMISTSPVLADSMDGFKWKRFELADKTVSGLESLFFIILSCKSHTQVLLSHKRLM